MNTNFTQWLRTAEDLMGEEIKNSWQFFAKAFEAKKTPEQAVAEFEAPIGPAAEPVSGPMNTERNVIRIGTLGQAPQMFPWEFTAPEIPATDMIIVYADDTLQAVDLFRARYPKVLRFEISWMADNE